MAAETNTLVLWDVDLTLVDYSGIGKKWYRTALANVFGMEMTHLPEFPGRTERAITRELLVAHGVDGGDEVLTRMFAELVSISQAAADDMRSLGRALPGAGEVLSALDGRTDVVQSLVTGNLPEVADAKLRPFGLDRHVDLEIGGYGAISEHRRDLVADAISRASVKHDREFAPTSVVVLGDTPEDVTAALHHDTIAIGVTTGRHGSAELTEAGAHHVLDDLSDTEAVLAAVLRR